MVADSRGNPDRGTAGPGRVGGTVVRTGRTRDGTERVGGCVQHGTRELRDALTYDWFGVRSGQRSLASAASLARSSPSLTLGDLEETNQRLQVGEQLLSVNTTRERTNELSRRPRGKQTDQAVEIDPHVPPHNRGGLMWKKRVVTLDENWGELGTRVLGQGGTPSGE